MTISPDTPQASPLTATPQQLDAADPLAAFRGRYLPHGDDIVAYLDGNSLGRPLKTIKDAWNDLVDHQWGERLIRSWTEGWMELPEIVGDELAAAMLGAAPGQTTIADSTTVNFYKAMWAAAQLRPDRKTVVIDRDNFPTDRYVVEGLAQHLGLEIRWLQADLDSGLTVRDVESALDNDVAVVTASQIAYRSGHIADVQAITAAAHDAGALVVWDLCHSVGVYDIQLDAWDVDFAVGCTYKFVGGGPGAPALIYAATRHHDAMRQPIWGWLGRADSFGMEQGYTPAPGIRSMISGTPAVPGILAVREGVKVIAEAGIPAIREKSIKLTEMVVAIYDESLAPLGFTLTSPRDPGQRGGHVTISRPDARELCQAVIARGVIPDFRTPDGIRIGLSPLPASFSEVAEALDVIRAAAG